MATPIGNLEDLGPRAARILRSVDLVAAEDTRTSRPLLRSIGASAPCMALHAHNEVVAADEIVARIGRGQSVALITDAGTPAISDPGARLVAMAHGAGVSVVPIPGASAATALVSAAGLPDGRFLFEGFLPSRPKQRRDRLAALAALQVAFLFFEAPHRVQATAADLLATLDGDRVLVLGRELTKRFEQIARLTVSGLPGWLAHEANRRRGEFALLVFPASSDRRGVDIAQTGAAGGTDEAGGTRPELSATGIRAMAVLSASMPPRQAARLAARISGDAADDLYRRSVRDRERPAAPEAAEEGQEPDRSD